MMELFVELIPWPCGFASRPTVLDFVDLGERSGHESRRAFLAMIQSNGRLDHFDLAAAEWFLGMC